MNLYDLSIGEDKMNQFLSIALKTHFESLKVSGKGENYWQCYQAFLNYCDIYGDCDLKDLFNNKLLRQDIVRACVLYYNSSAKAHRKEAVNRFLSAIDLFYKNYIKKMGGIECSALEGGCRNNEMIEDIEKCLNTKLKQEIYCPIDDKIEIEIIKICNNLKKSDFYKFGQKILCNLLLKYGFKLNLLVNLKKADVNDIDGIITIRNKDSVINLSVDKSMVSDIRQYNMVHRYPNREYFFLNTKGKKITSSSALATIQEKLEEVNNINTTTLALKGVSKLIQKGLTLSEIKYLTGFETKKIEDVSRWLMNQEDVESVINNKLATVYKGNIIKNLIMDCQSYTKYRPNETTGGIFVSWRRKEELPTGA